MGKKEEEIKSYLKSNEETLNQLEPGLALHETYCYKGRKSPMLRQIDTSKSDLLCFNKNDNATVVVEIKTGTATHHTFGQILYYLDYVKGFECPNAKHDKQNHKKVRGIVLANKIAKPLETLITNYKNFIPEIRLKKYYWDKDNKLKFCVLDDPVS